MDKLFTDLLQQIERLIEVGQKAFDVSLSELGQKDQQEGMLSNYQKSWHRYLEEIEDNHVLLQNILNQVPEDDVDGNPMISRRLAFYRGLPRRLSEGADPVWSSLYPQIVTLFDDIAVSLGSIFRKHHMGQHWYGPNGGAQIYKARHPEFKVNT